MSERVGVRRLPDGTTVSRIVAAVAAGSETAYWLDSSSFGLGLGAPCRFSVCGISRAEAGEVLRIESVEDSGRDVVAELRRALHRPAHDVVSAHDGASAHGAAFTAGATPPDTTAAPAFVVDLRGGFVGFLGYEAKVGFGYPGGRTARTPDAVWMRLARYVVEDHTTGQAWAVGEQAWLEVVDRAAADTGSSPGASRDGEMPPIHFPVPGRESYQAAVRACLEEIREGNSYEVCLTAETTAAVDLPFTLDSALRSYREQRRRNPAPHGAFLWGGDFAVLSSSPERFLSVDAEGRCEAKPIKGTAPRCEDPEADAEAARCLSTDAKTRAENLMIVDLMRNDFSRVCDPASISVPSLMEVESYASVHQLVSTVRGKLEPGKDALDLLTACFPGGSMTGAPKPSTLEIIDRLEGRARGVYSGALGYLTPGGAADLSIVIRTLVVTTGTGGSGILASVAAGGAVVADSTPEDEYREMLAKLWAPLPRGWTVERTPFVTKAP